MTPEAFAILVHQPLTNQCFKWYSTGQLSNFSLRRHMSDVPTLTRYYVVQSDIHNNKHVYSDFQISAPMTLEEATRVAHTLALLNPRQ